MTSRSGDLLSINGEEPKTRQDEPSRQKKGNLEEFCEDVARLTFVTSLLLSSCVNLSPSYYHKAKGTRIKIVPNK